MEGVLEAEGIFEATGFYIYPLALCSFLAAFIIIERVIALRGRYMLSESFLEKMLSGEIDKVKGDDKTVGGRILNFYRNHHTDRSAVKSFVDLEVSRMERGLYILDIVISAAPLIGLLGTVNGLIDVFRLMSPASGMPDSQLFMQGVALALSTTMIGLAIAIPALAGNSYLLRRVDVLAARLNVAMERMVDVSEAQQKK